ncbi:hypothetical protein QYF36_010700 [Acer negundo]|nr:hypothetical protein QYF36_010700 [Acer negundo]
MVQNTVWLQSNLFVDRFRLPLKEDFTKHYAGGKAATAVANSLNKEFGRDSEGVSFAQVFLLSCRFLTVEERLSSW